VAKHLGIRLTEVVISQRRILGNISLGIFLCETPRGTIVDESVALIEIARRLHKEGIKRVWMGEPADDLFGAFRFILSYYRGRKLQQHLRKQIVCDSPNEMAIVQNIFAPWGIAVFHGYWTRELLRIGHNLPLQFRVDRARLMKTILREAFRDDLPEEIVYRPKGVPRDVTGIRQILERTFGNSRERYRPIYKTLFQRGKNWPQSFFQALNSMQVAAPL
jgi:asparagine synthase (glutamine-hydrolysing)